MCKGSALTRKKGNAQTPKAAGGGIAVQNLRAWLTSRDGTELRREKSELLCKRQVYGLVSAASVKGSKALALFCAYSQSAGLSLHAWTVRGSLDSSLPGMASKGPESVESKTSLCLFAHQQLAMSFKKGTTSKVIGGHQSPPT